MPAVQSGSTHITSFTADGSFAPRGTISDHTQSWGLHSAAPGGVWYFLVTKKDAPTAVTEMIPMSATTDHYVRDGDTVPIGTVYLHDAGGGSFVIEQQ
jgi:hypothetical protein